MSKERQKSTREKNKDFAKSNIDFINACKNVDLESTKTRAQKYRQGKGLVHVHKSTERR